RAPYATGRDAPPGRLYVDGAPAFRWPCRRHRVCCDENKLPSLLRRGIAKSTTTSGQNLPTLSLAGIGETNETRETHETQNIRLVFWGLQRKHEEYCEVGVGLALPLTLFQVTEGKTWVAHTCRFVACVRPPAIECRRAWSPSSP